MNDYHRVRFITSTDLRKSITVKSVLRDDPVQTSET